MKNIIFLGDSYCCAWGNSKNTDNYYHSGQWQVDSTTQCSWLDVAADQLNLASFSFGFPGRSWYFSRIQFLQYLDRCPTLLDNTEAVVFCHSDHARFNSSNPLVTVAMQMPDYRPEASDSTDKSRALKLWLVDLVDFSFQMWAQEQWFREINRIFEPYPDIKLIHFNNFPFSVEISKLLNGCVYTTPLVHLSLAEYTGTKHQIEKQALYHDLRPNHFNNHNNQALGQLVADTVLDYKTGQYAIDTSKFDFKNPAAVNWPHGHWWTS